MEPKQAVQELAEVLLGKYLPQMKCDSDRIATALERIANIDLGVRSRNEEAMCKNCPYFDPKSETEGRDGCAIMPKRRITWPRNWCGQHPNFWRKS